jgi:hypothetical protein
VADGDGFGLGDGETEGFGEEDGDGVGDAEGLGLGDGDGDGNVSVGVGVGVSCVVAGEEVILLATAWTDVFGDEVFAGVPVVTTGLGVGASVDAGSTSGAAK